MTVYFDHEKLDVYQASIEFVAWSSELLSGIRERAAAKDQLDRAATSVPLNIAEGNGKFSAKDRCRFLGMANGSALECAACLDVLLAKRLIESSGAKEGKVQLKAIVSMMNGLLKSQQSRVREDGVEYEYE